MSRSITVRISNGLHNQLIRISKKEKKSVDDLVRMSLRKFVTRYRYNQLHAMTIPYAEAQGLFTDEDVFNRIS